MQVLCFASLGHATLRMTAKRNVVILNEVKDLYETGIHQADYETLIKLANYFDVSIDYLLEQTDNPQRLH